MAAVHSHPDKTAGEILAGTAPGYSTGEMAGCADFGSCGIPMLGTALRLIICSGTLGPATVSPLAQNGLVHEAQGARNMVESTSKKELISSKSACCVWQARRMGRSL